jgi:hypothetical protein
MLLGVSKTLQRFLNTRIPNSVGDWIEIAAIEQGDGLIPQDKLIVFLHAVAENPHLRNRPPQPTADGTGFVPAPMALSLYYLITYTGTAAKDVQQWLSQVLRSFYSQPRLGAADLDPSLDGTVDYLTVRLRTMEPEDIQRIWTALNVGMRFSLYYEVQAAILEPTEPEVTPPVAQSDALLDQGATA